MANPNNPLSFNAFASALGVMAVENTQTVGGVVQGVNANFTANLPLALSYAENRLQRDCPFLQATTSNSSYSLIPGSNLLALSVDDFVTIETISISGAPLLPVSREWLQNVYGSNATLAQPQYFAMYGGDAATGGATSSNIIVGPFPDSAYPLVVTGMIRMPSLYKFANVTDAATRTTYLSEWLPDALLTAAMIWVAGFQRDFGTVANNPESAVSWEQQYQAALAGAQTEEARRRFSGAAWSSMPLTPIATPGR